MNLSISRDGQEIGTWTEEKVLTLYREGQLLPTDYYWREGLSEWRELATLVKPPIPLARITETIPAEQTILPPFPTVLPKPIQADRKKSINIVYLLFAIAAWVLAQLVKAVVGVPHINPEIVGWIGAFLYLSCYGFVYLVYYLSKEKKFSYLTLSLVGALFLFTVYFFICNFDSFTKGVSYGATKEILLEDSQSVNSKLPKQIDEITRLDNTIVLEPLTIRSNYTLLSAFKPTQDMLDKLRPSLFQSLQGSPALRSLRGRGVTFDYEYSYKDGSYLGKIVITPTDAN